MVLRGTVQKVSVCLVFCSLTYYFAYSVMSIRWQSHLKPAIESIENKTEVDAVGAKLSRVSASNLIDLNLLSNATELEVENIFVRVSESTEIVCNKSDRIGNTGDGGWDVCEMGAYRPRSPCLVYSFGINYDWSFDDGLVERYGCLVRSFDPSMPIENHWRDDDNVFFKLGLGGRDTILKNLWMLNKLKTIQRLFGEEDKIIDYLKFDIEGSEWETLNASVRDGSLSKVKQLAFEVHTDVFNGTVTPAPKLRFYLSLLNELRNLGFYRWYAHRNTLAPNGTSVLSGDELWCLFHQGKLAHFRKRELLWCPEHQNCKRGVRMRDYNAKHSLDGYARRL